MLTHRKMITMVTCEFFFMCLFMVYFASFGDAVLTENNRNTRMQGRRLT